MGAARKIYAADLFCGAGGTSMGLARACEDLDYTVELLAINHWARAIATHTKNHPWARHLCARIEEVDPRKEIPGGRLDLLVASPECIWHSTARGGKPINDQARTTAWRVVEWAEKLNVSNILIENVPEFQGWGPLNQETGRPIKSKRGEIFRSFIRTLESFNYRVEYKVLNAADFGDATTRRRLFILARKGNRRIKWPEQSHAKDVDNLFGKLKPWRAAREIIDWGLQGESIFTRKRPLAKSTMERIAAGLRKFCGKAAEPFIVMLNAHSQPSSVGAPLPTVVAGGNHAGLCEPFILPQFSSNAPRSVDKPVPTLTTTSRGVGLVEPFILQQQSGGAPRSVSKPLPAIATKGAQALVEPFIVTMEHSKSGNDHVRGVDRPLPTITTARGGAMGVVEPYIVPTNHGTGDVRAHQIDKPMPTVTTVDAWGLVQPVLVKFYGDPEKNNQPVTQPLHTVTTKDRFGLVEPEARVGIDIRFRMLRPHELAAAMGFEKYQFTGSREEQVKQIGNAVPVNIAKALCRALLES